MAQIQFQKTNKIAGELTNVYSFTLGVTDPNGNYVVPLGTPMVNTGVGTYQYTFDVPVPGQIYTVQYTVFSAQGMSPIVWNEEVATGEEVPAIEVFPPSLTGLTLEDTLLALRTQRLNIVMKGPAPNYSLHGHQVSFQDYLDYLDRAIAQIMRELAQSEPFESVGIGM